MIEKFLDEVCFFDIAFEAIAQEELELNKLFEMNHEFYQNQHHGVCNLYETTYVYLIFKELLKHRFPHTVFWEYPYPSNSILHSDLALLDQEANLEALIEFKLWLKDDDVAIQRDIEKLSSVPGYRKYIYIIGYGGDIEENANYLMRKGKLRMVKMKSIYTRFFSSVEKKMISNPLNHYMFEVI